MRTPSTKNVTLTYLFVAAFVLFLMLFFSSPYTNILLISYGNGGLSLQFLLNILYGISVISVFMYYLRQIVVNDHVNLSDLLRVYGGLFLFALFITMLIPIIVDLADIVHPLDFVLSVFGGVLFSGMSIFFPIGIYGLYLCFQRKISFDPRLKKTLLVCSIVATLLGVLAFFIITTSLLSGGFVE